MKHVFSTSCAVFLSLLLLVTSCKKGDTGPAGADGPAGPGGPAGPQGPKGDEGTANVIYSDWLDVEFGLLEEDGDLAAGIIPAEELTQDILTSGDVKVYWNLGTADDPVIVSLPYTDNGLFFGPDITDLTNTPIFADGQIEMYSKYNLGTYEDGGDKFFQYRYIIIPGGTEAGGRSAINWNDYNSVKKYLKIPD